MQTIVLFCSLLIFLSLVTSGDSFHDIVKRASGGHHWNYEEDAGPIRWPHHFKQCGGLKQSPINIETSELDANEELNYFEFYNYNTPLKGAIIKNNGHTIQISPSLLDPRRTIDEGGLGDPYHFLQAHFHWGSDSKKGSEHTIDGKSFPLELHLVHTNENYNSLETVLKKEDGLAVLGILFKLDDEDNPALEAIIDKLDEVIHENTEATLADFTLESLLPKHTMPYYRYQGSLTTPQCNEIVTWTVFKEFVPISEKQLQHFRNIKEEDDGEPEEYLMNNFRPPQPLNKRNVEISGRSNSASSFGSSMMSVLSFLSFLL